MADEVTDWGEDLLEYGYVLDRMAGGWWHLHIGRSARSYHCELLDRRTDILACVQWFATGAVAESPQFLLTLDGEGVELPAAEVGLDFRWGDRPADPELAAAARQFQRDVMPLLYDSPAFQRAAAELLARQRYLRVVAPGKLTGPNRAV